MGDLGVSEPKFTLLDRTTATMVIKTAGLAVEPDFDLGVLIVDGTRLSVEAFRAYATGLADGAGVMRHAASCGNQNAIQPLGVFIGARECGCRRAS